jgi:CheY-like chemotaxis protein
VNKRVLVLDDNDSVRLSVVRVLESRGHEAVGVDSADGAVALAQREHFDVALCDIHLPTSNGIEAALQIQQGLPHCRVVLISGDSGSSDLLETAERAGHNFEVLAKPFDPRTLLAVVAGQPVQPETEQSNA